MRFIHRLFKLSCQCGSQMSTGRESHYTHPVRIDSPLLRMLTHQTDGLLRILKRTVRRVIHNVFQWHAVFQHKCGNTCPGETAGDIKAFFIDGQPFITATG